MDGKNLGCIKDHRDFILSHDLSGISPGLHVTMGVGWDDQMTIENIRPFRAATTRSSSPLFSQARHFQVASSTLVPEHQLATALAVR